MKSNSQKNKTRKRTVAISCISLFIDQNPVKESTEARFLGVIFDPLLNWSAHIAELNKKLRVSIAILKRITPYIPDKNYKNLYHTLFESHLGYCISVWGGAKRKLIEPLFTLQKRSVRFLFGAQADFLEKINTAARIRPFGQQILRNISIKKNIQSHYS